MPRGTRPWIPCHHPLHTLLLPSRQTKAPIHPTPHKVMATASHPRDPIHIRLHLRPTMPRHVCHLNLREISNADQTGVASRHAPSQLPPIQLSSPTSEHAYPRSATAQLNAVFGHEVKSPRHQAQPSMNLLSRDSVPKFTKLNSVQELEPKINAQPAFRRANPEGGFISVSLGPVSIEREAPH